LGKPFQNISFQAYLDYEFMEISSRGSVDFLEIVPEGLRAGYQGIFGSKRVDQVHFLLEKEGFHQLIHTLCIQLPKDRFPCHSFLLPKVREGGTNG